MTVNATAARRPLGQVLKSQPTATARPAAGYRCWQAPRPSESSAELTPLTVSC